MEPSTLTNLLLTGILVVQCYSVIFRARAERGKRESNNPPKFGE